MKKMFQEFKKFITRGNVVDLAVGVIIGGAFTAIVTALTANIFTPLINALIHVISGSGDGISAYTILVPSYKEGVIDLASSIYIDWGAFISAIINFIIVALVLFFIVKAINRLQDNRSKLLGKIAKNTLTKEDRKTLKAQGVKLSDKTAVKAYLKEKEAKELEETKKAEAEAKAQEEEAKRHTTEGLLEEIKALLEKQAQQK